VRRPIDREPAQLPADLSGRNGDLGGCRSEGLVVAQHAHRGEQDVPHAQRRRVDRDFRLDSAQRPAPSIMQEYRMRCGGQPQAHGRVLSFKPRADAAVAGRKCDEDARLHAGSDDQVGRRVANSHEAVGDLALIDAERERLRILARPCQRAGDEQYA
jgi:hypothetical protein